MVSRSLWVATILLSSVAIAARGDRITLKDGTVLEGVAIQQGDKYWVKTTDGGTRTIPMSSVASITSGNTPAPATGAKTATPAPSSPTGGPAFIIAQRRTLNVSTALAAVTIWQKFIDENPKDTDLPAAKAELDRWQKLADDGAE